MNRLLEAELIYGRLLTIREPHLVARYNKALSGFGLPETKLAEFDIDITGFSPQIAAEFGDPDYLDPKKVNRRFIILTPEQNELPVVHTSFSNTAGLMHEFFAANLRAIHAITLKDTLYGEIEDSVAEVLTLEHLLSINEVTFKVLSAEDLLGKAGELRRLCDQLATSATAWRDDAMLNRMVALASEAGDIRQNTLVPDKLVFRHDAFWADHFGGVFVFVDEKITTVICDPEAPSFRRSRPWQVSYISIHDSAQVFDFLARTGRIELPRASWVEASGLLAHRAEMVLLSVASRLDPVPSFTRVDPVWLQTLQHGQARAITEHGVYPVLQEALRTLQKTGGLRIADVEPRYRPWLVRALPSHADQWLTNRLIAHLTADDFVSRFVFDKQGFYRTYDDYPEAYRDYVVSRLKATYLQDKTGFRNRLYGLGDQHA
ncbi:DUF6638 family protein [Rhizobium sp. AAP43]|uniref:DUF6638 family protein n=1 Tax=Rhizobium sp. AAP43 TaxID=1523420 RepID=UPI0006B9B2EB|nr:DUF6638 family protein [Rhizobium sp. AAP43]KPF46502.1 hypothetical protein IP76_06460 [Rhizobium sp. AAP43]